MKISVIIPVYNAEKYLGVCLESLLIQTFTDFEVIVVDDCSTDNSVAIAESYLEKFSGRLKIITLSENSGTAAVPRNVGLDFSCGKYIFFADADDLIVDDALETLYTCAEEFQAEVVYTESGFNCGKEAIPQKIVNVTWNPPNFVTDEPIFESENILERMEKFSNRGIAWTPWTKFVQRDFLIRNEIKFPQMRTSDDFVWTVKILCLAKNILRVPQPLYIYRSVGESITRKNSSPKEHLRFWSGSFIDGLLYLNEFLNEFESRFQMPKVRFLVLNLFSNVHLGQMTTAFKNLKLHEAYEIFLQELSTAEKLQSATTAYLLLMTNFYRNELTK